MTPEELRERFVEWYANAWGDEKDAVDLTHGPCMDQYHAFHAGYSSAADEIERLQIRECFLREEDSHDSHGDPIACVQCWNAISELKDELERENAALKDEIERLKQDAKRYRWLRENAHVWSKRGFVSPPESVDEACDAAMEAK